MNARKKLSIAIAALLTSGAVWESLRQWTERRALARREIGYRTTTASIQRIVRLGMGRVETESVLLRNGYHIERRGKDDYVPLAREASAVWYCSWRQAMVLRVQPR